MTNKFLLVWLVVFIVWMTDSLGSHGILRESCYVQLSDLLRWQHETGDFLHLVPLAHVVIAAPFARIHQGSAETELWLRQALRSDFAVALIGPLPM